MPARKYVRANPMRTASAATVAIEKKNTSSERRCRRDTRPTTFVVEPVDVPGNCCLGDVLARYTTATLSFSEDWRAARLPHSGTARNQGAKPRIAKPQPTPRQHSKNEAHDHLGGERRRH